VGGAPAETFGKSLASSRASARIVTDPDASFALALDVHAVPLILVISRDGSEIARIDGNAETLAIKLPAYLDLATGTIDAAEAQRRITHLDAPDIDAQLKASRDARRVEYLIDTGRPADAVKLLVTLPTTEIPPWRHNLLGAKALIALDRWREAESAAETALQQNPDAPEIHYLLGRIHEHAQDWPRAAAEYRAAATQPASK